MVNRGWGLRGSGTEDDKSSSTLYGLSFKDDPRAGLAEAEFVAGLQLAFAVETSVIQVRAVRASQVAQQIAVSIAGNNRMALETPGNWSSVKAQSDCGLRPNRKWSVSMVFRDSSATSCNVSTAMRDPLLPPSVAAGFPRA